MAFLEARSFHEGNGSAAASRRSLEVLRREASELSDVDRAVVVNRPWSPSRFHTR